MKTNILKGLAGLLLCLSAGLVSCEKETDSVNSLELSSSADIEFAATDNNEVVLTVKTDAAEWNVMGPIWIRTTLDVAAGKCRINVDNNVSTSPRVGRLEFSAGNAQPVYVAVIQAGAEEGEDVLAVEPKEAIYFNAKGNLDAEVSVETNVAEGWEVTAPEWVILTKGEGKLTINVKENDTDGTRSGRITITAGEATPVHITVVQRNTVEEAESVVGQVRGKDGAIDISLSAIDDTENIEETLTSKITVQLAQPAADDVTLVLSVDEAYLDEYNFNHGTSCELVDVQYVEIANNGEVTIEAGETTAEVEVTITVNQLTYNTDYLVPIAATATSDNLTIAYAYSRVNYAVSRKFEKTVKNFLFFEVNDTNPLNALEYRLPDGQYFFDVVVIFAANINYNGEEDRVYLNNNPNVQALLDNTEIYIQPLRKAGIKVELGLLGNGDRAGLTGLSDWGAREWAKEVAEACRFYKLDGVNLDDEYSTYTATPSNRWFISSGSGWSSAAGSRLAYELKTAMNEACDWPCEVSYFQYNRLASASAVDGHQPGEFIDINVANYGDRAKTFTGQTLKNCSYESFQCNTASNLSRATESTARAAVSGGYGWLMWFAWDPNPESGIYHDRDSYINNVAKGLYGKEIVTPKYYYKKIGSGEYDPTPYARQ